MDILTFSKRQLKAVNLTHIQKLINDSYRKNKRNLYLMSVFIFDKDRLNFTSNLLDQNNLILGARIS